MLLPCLSVLGALVLQAPPMPFQIGETLRYDARLGGFPIGAASIQVERVDTALGDSAYVFAMKGQGGPPGVTVGYEMRSWVNRARFVSRRFYTTAIQQGTAYQRRYVIRDDSLRYREEGSHVDLETVPDALDELAFLYYLRTLTLAPGDSLVLRRYFKSTYNPVVVKSAGRDNALAGDGVQRPCRVLTLTALGTTTTIWLTDDERRVPVQMAVPLGYGVVTLVWDGRG